MGSRGGGCGAEVGRSKRGLGELLSEVEKCLWKVGNANIKQDGKGIEVNLSRGGDGEDERGRLGDNGEGRGRGRGRGGGGARAQGDGATGGEVTKAGV